MAVQIVQHDSDHFRLWKEFIDQGLHLVGELLAGAALGHDSLSPSSQGLEQQKEVTTPLPFILIILSTGPAGFHRQGLPNIHQQLTRPLVKTDHRTPRIIRLGIQVQHIFHPPNKIRCHLRNAASFLLPGFDLFFFSTRQTVSSEMQSTTFSSTSLSARSCIVQCSRPCGGSLQASAIHKASCFHAVWVVLLGKYARSTPPPPPIRRTVGGCCGWFDGQLSAHR